MYLKVYPDELYAGLWYECRVSNMFEIEWYTYDAQGQVTYNKKYNQLSVKHKYFCTQSYDKYFREHAYR